MCRDIQPQSQVSGESATVVFCSPYCEGLHLDKGGGGKVLQIKSEKKTGKKWGSHWTAMVWSQCHLTSEITSHVSTPPPPSPVWTAQYSDFKMTEARTAFSFKCEKTDIHSLELLTVQQNIIIIHRAFQNGSHIFIIFLVLIGILWPVTQVYL